MFSRITVYEGVMIFTEYVIENWPLLMVLLGFTASLITTVFLNKKTVHRMYALIAEVFILSILVFIEFNLVADGKHQALRALLIAIRYSSTPFLIAQIIYTIIKRQRWYIFIPAMITTIINFISLPTGIVFFFDESGAMKRGPLGLLPYVMIGVYCVWLVALMIRHSSKMAFERIPIIYFGFSFFAGLIMPFLIGKDYSKLFCATIGISIYVYYVFSILQVTKRDPLTGLLNRQAYYSDISNEPEEIRAIISIDMNGLKAINDNEGHAAGDLAISTIAGCFLNGVRYKHPVYRIGGDEFVVVCRKISEYDVVKITRRIHELVDATKYSCSIGYSYTSDGKKSIDELLSESDANMYKEKQQYYKANKS